LRRLDKHPTTDEDSLVREVWLPPGLQLARYRFTLEATTPLQLPSYKGSSLRGAFGRTLKALTCAQRGRERCRGCTLTQVCVYRRLFDPVSNETSSTGLHNMPRPFVLLPPLADNHYYSPGDVFQLEATLIGPAMDLFPYWVATLEEMGKRGVGKGRGEFRLTGVEAVDLLGKAEPVFDASTRQVHPADKTTSTDQIAVLASRLLEERVTGVRLQIATYLRIKANGQLQDKLTLPLLVRALLRRIDILSTFYGDGPVDWPYDAIFAVAEEAESILVESHWEDWSRVSFRQKACMKLGGVTGHLEYRGDSVGQLLPLLIAGQLLHCGKNTTFGLGAYRIVQLRRGD